MRNRRNFLAAGLTAIILISALAFAQADWTERFPTHVPPKRMNPAMAQFGSCSQSSCGSNVVMFGGLNLGPTGVFSQINVLADTWVWNGTDWSQVTTSVVPPARYGASMAYDPATGNAVLFGGQNTGNQFLGDTWVFGNKTTCTKRLGCVTSLAWTKVTFPAGASTPPSRAGATMATKPGSPPSLVGLSGGVTTTGLTFKYLSDTWVFNTITNTWTQESIAEPPARAYAAMAPCLGSGTGSSIMFGGFNGIFTGPLQDTWLFDFDLPEWFGPNLPQTTPAGRFGQGLAHYPVSGFRVLYGGQAVQSATGTSFLPTDTWNASCNPAPSTWSAPGGLLTPAHNPGHKMFHGMTTGPNGLTVLLFGGDDLPFPRSSGDSFPNGRDRSETWTWGRRVACLPVDGSEIPARSKVRCQFDRADGLQFDGWSANDFEPEFRHRANGIFEAHHRGPASITAQWTDADGLHSESFNYTVTRRLRHKKD